MFFILKIKMLVPNKPDNNGSNGCLTSRFRMINPKLPDNKKMIKAGIFCFSFRIKNIEAIINMNGMNFEIKG